MDKGSIERGLLPAGLSDVLYPNAHLQSKTIENLINVFLNTVIIELSLL